MRIHSIKNCAKFAQALGLVLVLVACGDLNVEQPKDEDQAQDDQGGVGETHEEASEKKPAGETSPAETTEPAEIKPKADDTATATAPKAESGPVPIAVVDGLPIFATMNNNNLCAWQACVDQAPAGYRLATSNELKALIAVGVAPFKDGEIWSATEESETIAIFVDGDSGRDARMDKTMPLNAVYVTESSGEEDEQ